MKRKKNKETLQLNRLSKASAKVRLSWEQSFPAILVNICTGAVNLTFGGELFVALEPSQRARARVFGLLTERSWTPSSGQERNAIATYPHIALASMLRKAGNGKWQKGYMPVARFFRFGCTEHDKRKPTKYANKHTHKNRASLVTGRATTREKGPDRRAFSDQKWAVPFLD